MDTSSNNPDSKWLGPFRYRFLAPPPLTIVGGPDEKTYGELIKELEGVVNMLASQGWEFVSVEHITVVPRMGLDELLEPDYENRTPCPFLVLRRPASGKSDTTDE